MVGFRQVGLDLLEAREVRWCLRFLDCYCVGDLLGSCGTVSYGSGDVNVDECTQAVVLTEVAAGVLVARGAVTDVADGVETDKRGFMAVPPKTQGFLCGADCAGFAAVLVDDDLRYATVGAETGVYEVDFGLDDGHVVLRAALQYEA